MSTRDRNDSIYAKNPVPAFACEDAYALKKRLFNKLIPLGNNDVLKLHPATHLWFATGPCSNRSPHYLHTCHNTQFLCCFTHFSIPRDFKIIFSLEEELLKLLLKKNK